MRTWNVITELEQITPQLLTDILQHEGYLAQGPQEQVVSVEVESSSAIASIVYRLNVRYSGSITSALPTRFLLKVSKPNSSVEAARKEVEFYNSVASQMPGTHLVRCFHAAFCTETGRGHVLMEDLAATHGHPAWPLPPERAGCEQAIDCLASLHAFWRDHPALGTTVGTLPNTALFKGSAHKDAAIYARFKEFMGDRLSQERQHILERVVACHVYIEQRLTTQGGLTLVHGDAHVWNFLYPHKPGTASAHIFDWQTWEVHNGLVDMAYLIAVHWYPQRRKELERPLVERYHAILVTQGVTDYDWDTCWNDYRLGVIHHLFLPVRQWNWNLPTFLWWSHFERIVTAYEDLHCEELLPEE